MVNEKDDIFSEELKFALGHGYNITVLKGYEFSRNKDVFNSYIYEVFNHKAEAKNPTQRSIAKSLLNNLLGRFGIDLQKYETKLLNHEEFEYMSHMRDIKGYNTIGSMNLVSYSTSLNYELIEELDMDLNEVLKSNKDSEVKPQSGSSVAISAAVTAYARIIITQHKLDILNRGGEIYYSDTDSIVTNIELPPHLVSNQELGKFKLEYKVKKGIFISGKTYCLVLEDGTIIKKAKGVRAENLHYNDYFSLLNNSDVKGLKTSTKKDYTKRSVQIEDEQVLLRSDAYIKRTKLYKDLHWVDTKPIFINSIDKSLILYKPPC